MKPFKGILVICLFLLFSSCTQNETPIKRIQPFIEKAINHQVGSYYLLKDSVTNVVDSFPLTLNHKSSFYALGEFTETYNSVFKSSNNFEFSFFTMGESNSISLRCTNFDWNYGSIVYGFYMNNGSYSRSIDFKNTCLQIHDSLEINNQVYYKVYETYYQYYRAQDTAYMHKFYSLQDGLIKLRLHGNGVDKVYTTIRHLQFN
jgi:hypothetical protein